MELQTKEVVNCDCGPSKSDFRNSATLMNQPFPRTRTGTGTRTRKGIRIRTGTETETWTRTEIDREN